MKISEINDYNTKNRVVKLCQKIKLYDHDLDQKEGNQFILFLISVLITIALIVPTAEAKEMVNVTKDLIILFFPCWAIYFYVTKRKIANKRSKMCIELEKIGYRYDKDYGDKKISGIAYDKYGYSKPIYDMDGDEVINRDVLIFYPYNKKYILKKV
jgi:hypothetical protein